MLLLDVPYYEKNAAKTLGAKWKVLSIKMCKW